MGKDARALARRLPAALPAAGVAAWGLALLWPTLPWAGLSRLWLAGTKGILVVPAIVLLVAALRPHERPWRLAAAGATMVLAGFYGVPLVTATPALAFTLPALALAAGLGARWPTLSLAIGIGVLGFEGTLSAYTTIPVRIVSDAFLLAFVAGVALRAFSGRRARRVRIYPAVALLAAYVAVSAAAILASPSLIGGVQAFRTAQWFLLVAIAVGVSAMDAGQRMRIVKALLVINAAVAGYAALRYITGPTGKEESLALATLGVYNTIGGELRLLGSFRAASEIALWSLVSACFCLSLALAMRGRWRILAGATAGISLFVIMACGVRTGLLALIPAMVLLIVAYNGSPAFPGPRPLVVGLLAMTLVVGGGAALSLTVLRNEGLRDRFESLLNPTNDESYQARLLKWRAALADVDRHPLGEGLGVASTTSLRYSRFVTPGQTSIDSSYLKILIEQGPAVLAIFVVALLGLAWTFAATARRARDALDAALLVGGASTIAGLLVLYYAGNFVEDPVAPQGFVLLGLSMAALAVPARQHVPAPATRRRRRARREAAGTAPPPRPRTA